MGQVNPRDFSFHINQGDLLPALAIQITDEDTGLPLDLTTYTGKFYMAPVNAKDTPKINGVAVNITNATEGEAEYRWSGTDTDTPGSFYFEFRFTAASKTFTVPVISPGKVFIETKIG